MSYEPFPGFVGGAPQENINFLQGYSLPPATIDHHPRAVLTGVVTARKVASAINATGRPSTPDFTPNSFAELESGMHDWLDESYGHIAADDSARNIIEIGQDGITTIRAFIEVVPQVVALAGVLRSREGDINIAIHPYVERSQRFIRKWAGFSTEADIALAQSLDLESRNGKRRTNIFENLQFDPAVFALDATQKRVSLDADMARKLRSYRNHRPSDVLKRTKPEMLYGCPAMHMIPRLYQTMSTLALRGSLYEQSYDRT